jgi:hypothetical protein
LFVEGKPVLLQVRFKLTDMAGKPLSGVASRLVLGGASDTKGKPNWQDPNAGHRITTDAQGEARFSTPVTLVQRQRKMTSGGVAELLSRPQPTENLHVAVELGYMKYAWLYAVELTHWSKNGDVSLEAVWLYCKDARGHFTRRAEPGPDSGSWKIPDLSPLLMTGIGHEVTEFLLEPDKADLSHKRWNLALTFKRFPPPVVR